MIPPMASFERALPPVSNRIAILSILGASAGILGFLFWLIYFQEPGESAVGRDWAASLPAFNAFCNLLSSSFIVMGVFFIRRRNFKAHGVSMLLATVSSAAFLTGYIIYHQLHGDTRFTGEGWVRPVYFFILISHILLSMAVVPLVLSSLFFAATRKWSIHRKLSRWTYPVWLYVSVTGVLVFLFLRYLNG